MSKEISIQYMMSHLCPDFVLCICKFIGSFSLLSTTHDSNYSRNSLAVNILNYLNNILQEIFDIEYFKFCCLLNFPTHNNSTGLDGVKKTTQTNFKVPVFKSVRIIFIANHSEVRLGIICLRVLHN